jgi:hypothetical protein
LDCIRPSAAGALPGYRPSGSFAQTFAMDWARGGPAVARTRAVEAQAQAGVGEALRSAFANEALGGAELARAATVCRAWRDEIAGNDAATAKVEDAQEALRWPYCRSRNDFDWHSSSESDGYNAFVRYGTF